MDRAPDLAPVRRGAAPARRVVGAAQRDELAGGVADGLRAGHETGEAEPHLPARREAAKPARRVLHEVRALDEELARERNPPSAGRRVVGVVERLDLLDAPLRPGVDDQPERVEHRHAAPGRPVHHLAHAVFEQRRVHQAVGSGDSDAADEVGDGRRRHAAASQPGQGRHSRVVPAGNAPLLDEARQPPLGKHGVGQVEPGEFVLARPGRRRQGVDQPVVERPVIGEFQGAERVRDAFDRVALAVGVIVGREDAPVAAGPRVPDVEDAVEHGVAQVDVPRRHVDLRPQHSGAVRELARPHPAQQIEALLDRAVPPGAVGSGFGQGAPGAADLLGALVVDIGLAAPHQPFGPVVEPVEIVRGEPRPPAPVAAQPADVLLDRADEGRVLARRVGVVEAQAATPAELLGDAEIEHDRLRVADMEIPVGFGREPGDDRGRAPGLEVPAHGLADEVARSRPGPFPSGHAGRPEGGPSRATIEGRIRMGPRG